MCVFLFFFFSFFSLFIAFYFTSSYPERVSLLFLFSLSSTVLIFYFTLKRRNSSSSSSRGKGIREKKKSTATTNDAPRRELLFLGFLMSELPFPRLFRELDMGGRVRNGPTLHAEVSYSFTQRLPLDSIFFSFFLFCCFVSALLSPRDVDAPHYIYFHFLHSRIE